MARIKQAYSSLEDTIAQVRNSNKKLEKEKWALHARLQENLRETPSADDLATLRRALDAERECESVKMQLESMKRTAKQHRLEDDVHVKKLEAQLEEANRTIASWTVCLICIGDCVDFCCEMCSFNLNVSQCTFVCGRHAHGECFTVLCRVHDIMPTMHAGVQGRNKAGRIGTR